MAEVKLLAPKIPILLLCILSLFFAIVIALPPSLLQGMIARDISITIVSGADPVLTRVISGLAADYDLIRRVSVRDDLSVAEAELKSGKVDVLLIIPDDIETAVLYGEPITVTVKANDPLLGTLAYRLSKSTVDTINALVYITSYVYESNQDSDLNSAGNMDSLVSFVNQVLLDAVIRFSYIDDIAVSKPYDTQAISLVSFFAVAVTSVFAAVISAGQIADGYLRRLTVRGCKIRELVVIKIINTAFLALFLNLFVLIGFYYMNLRCDPLKYLLSVGLQSVIVTGICLCVTAVNSHRAVAVTRTLIGCTFVLLMLLFWGGGFYPIYLMQTSFKKLNPAWLSHLLADWSLSGLFPPAGHFALFLLPFAVCSCLAVVRMRRSVCS